MTDGGEGVSVDEATVRYRMEFADAAFGMTAAGSGSDEHRELMFLMATERLSAEEAVTLACRQHGVSLDRSDRPRITEWADYEFPGSPVLRSRVYDAEHPDGLDDPDRLRAVVQDLSRLRLVELAIAPVTGVFDFHHIKELHRRIFADVYPWAGEQRVGPDTAMIRFAPDAVNFAPGDPAAPMIKYAYPSGPEIAEAASALFAQLEYLSRRTSGAQEELLDIMAELGAELFALHPFRDGNARTIWAYGVELDESLGLEVDFSQMLSGSPSQDHLMHSSYRYQATGDFDEYFQTLTAGVRPARAGRVP